MKKLMMTLAAATSLLSTAAFAFPTATVESIKIIGGTSHAIVWVDSINSSNCTGSDGFVILESNSNYTEILDMVRQAARDGKRVTVFESGNCSNNKTQAKGVRVSY